MEPSTVTNDQWTYLWAVEGMPSELYNIKEDPDQESNVIDEHPEVAQRMRKVWLEFLESHEAPEARLKPYTFRDDVGQWVAFPTEREAFTVAFRDDAPGPERTVEETSFGAILDDNPKNLIHMYGQFYWAEDLA